MDISCREIYEKSWFDSYSEFYLMLCMAKECYRRGISLDVSGMNIEKDVTPKPMIEYFKYLISIGAIKGEGLIVNEKISNCDLNLDTSCFTYLEEHGMLLNLSKDKYIWSYEWSCESYKNYSGTLLVFHKLGNILLHIVGYYLISRHLGKLPNIPFEIQILNSQKVANTFIYINLLSCSKTLKCFDNIILNIDFSSFRSDVDYAIFCNNGSVAGRDKLWTFKEKISFLEKENMPVGGIYILWERDGMCPSNPIGRLVNSSVVQLNGVYDNYIAYTKISIAKTHEEIIDDYYDIPEDKRAYFKDMLNFSVNISKETKDYSSLGIRNYFSMDEDFFIDKIDKYARVTKKITINGNSDYIDLSEIDAIYWLLCQNNIDFDKELYKNIYNNGNSLLWDLYN